MKSIKKFFYRLKTIVLFLMASLIPRKDKLFPSSDSLSIRENIQEKGYNDSSVQGCNECNHTNHYIEHGERICNDCGLVLDQVNYDVDWKSFGAATRDESRDQIQAQKKVSQQRSIKNELMKKNFSENSSEIANEYFQTIIAASRKSGKQRIFRGSNRDALMASCIFYAQSAIGESMDSHQIRARFGSNLTQGKFNDGLDIFTEIIPGLRCKYLEPQHLIPRAFQKLGIRDPQHFNKASALCTALKNKSNLMNSSKPNSIAAAIVYLCLNSELKNMGITKTNFADKIGLSDATIDKLVKDAENIMEKQNIKIV